MRRDLSDARYAAKPSDGTRRRALARAHALLLDLRIAWIACVLLALGSLGPWARQDILSLNEDVYDERLFGAPHPDWGVILALVGSVALVASGVLLLRAPNDPPDGDHRPVGRGPLIVTWIVVCVVAAGAAFILALRRIACEDDPLVICEGVGGSGPDVLYDVLIVAQLVIVGVGGLAVLASGKPFVPVRRGTLLGAVFVVWLGLLLAARVLGDVRA